MFSNNALVMLVAAVSMIAWLVASGATVSTYRSVLSSWFRSQIDTTDRGARMQLSTIRKPAVHRRQRGARVFGDSVLGAGVTVSVMTILRSEVRPRRPRV